MPERIEREIARFEAETESGRVLTVISMQEFLETTHMQSPGREWIAGLKRWELEDGQPVNCIDPKTFKIVSTNEIIRKIG